MPVGNLHGAEQACQFPHLETIFKCLSQRGPSPRRRTIEPGTDRVPICHQHPHLTVMQQRWAWIWNLPQYVERVGLLWTMWFKTSRHSKITKSACACTVIKPSWHHHMCYMKFYSACTVTKRDMGIPPWW